MRATAALHGPTGRRTPGALGARGPEGGYLHVAARRLESGHSTLAHALQQALGAAAGRTLSLVAWSGTVLL